ncbi:MAG: alpha/beta fold hydrolase [Bdellovibrionales bacterium]
MRKPRGHTSGFSPWRPRGRNIAHLSSIFDPDKFHIILFDQRGAGKSTPHAELRQNTTWDLINDIEQLREKFNIDSWHVFGGSWGSTLALIYAIHHQNRVRSLLLRGIFYAVLTRSIGFTKRAPVAFSKTTGKNIFLRPFRERKRQSRCGIL